MKVSRRSALATGAWLLAGCQSKPRASASRPDPLENLPSNGERPETLRIGVTPSSGDRTVDFFKPLSDYLADVLDGPVSVVASDTYDALADMVVASQVDLGFFSPAAYVKARRSIPAVAIATAARGGSPTYLGYLTVRRDSGITTLEELEGATVAWVSESSTSGYLYPRAMMRHRGLDPDTFFAAPPRIAGDHLSSVEAVISGAADVGAVASSFVDPGPFDLFEGADQLHVVAKSARIPLDCAVLRRAIDRSLGTRVRDALLQLVEHRGPSEALSHSWGISSFVSADDRRYDVIEEVLRAEGEDIAREGSEH